MTRIFLNARFIAIFILSVTSLFVHASPIVRRWSRLPWMGSQYNNPDFLRQSGTDKTVFSKTLTGVTLGAKLAGNTGDNNMALFHLGGTYEGHAGGSLLLKLLQKIDNNALSEVKALEDVKDLVASGMFQYETELVPAIIMKKKNGVPITQINSFMSAPKATQEVILKEVVKKMCAEVAEVATTNHVLHSDNHQGNVLVVLSGNTVSEVNLVDYGVPLTNDLPGVVSVEANVKAADVIEWCTTTWSNYWLVETSWYQKTAKVGPPPKGGVPSTSGTSPPKVGGPSTNPPPPKGSVPSTSGTSPPKVGGPSTNPHNGDTTTPSTSSNSPPSVAAPAKKKKGGRIYPTVPEV